MDYSSKLLLISNVVGCKGEVLPQKLGDLSKKKMKGIEKRNKSNALWCWSGQPIRRSLAMLRVAVDLPPSQAVKSQEQLTWQGKRRSFAGTPLSRVTKKRGLSVPPRWQGRRLSRGF